MAGVLPSLPAQAAGTPWPTGEWPGGSRPGAIPARAASLLDAAFADSSGDLGETHAVVIVQRGRLQAERYAEGLGSEVTCRSWSMAKSITHALVGLAVGDGRLNVHAPADAPAWRGAADPRAAITLDQLLRMSSGLAWIEDYSPDHPSDVIEMLFGKGAGDVAGFAEAAPLAQAPGEFFYYSSGTTNIICACLGRALSASGPAMEAFMRERLFARLGMTSAAPRFDAAATFIGSSYCFCTPRDFARFGLLYLRDGIWEGRRLLPEGWVDYARTPTYLQPGADVDGGYGAHWWLDIAGPGSFSANGYEGQHIVLCPDRDLIIVRHGATPTATQPAVRGWLRDLAAEFG
jgi:CubicO group peptidase (beta-lactamase class C family)